MIWLPTDERGVRIENRESPSHLIPSHRDSHLILPTQKIVLRRGSSLFTLFTYLVSSVALPDLSRGWAIHVLVVICKGFPYIGLLDDVDALVELR